MKAEIVSHPTKGMCILISGIDPDSFLGNFPVYNSVFSEPVKIAECLRRDRYIQAIKEARKQTGWGLKETKEYLDKYRYRNPDDNYSDNYTDTRLQNSPITQERLFLTDHMAEDFIEKGDLEL